MASTIEKLQKIKETKLSLKDKINEKGENITDSTPFADYVNELDNIGGGEDDTDTLIKSIAERTITEIVIPKETNFIGQFAFCECRTLKNVTIKNEDNFTKIEHYAFQYCQELETINLPSSITYLGKGCFQQCIKLKIDLDLSNLTRLQEATFFNCQKITNVNIGNQITIIDKQAFQYCYSLVTLTIPSQITSIGVQALQIGTADNKATITFEGTTPPTIGTNTFDINKLEAIRVPMSAIDTYKSATNWSNFADIIVGY